MTIATMNTNTKIIIVDMVPPIDAFNPSLTSAFVISDCSVLLKK